MLKICNVKIQVHVSKLDLPRIIFRFGKLVMTIYRHKDRVIHFTGISHPKQLTFIKLLLSKYMRTKFLNYKIDSIFLSHNFAKQSHLNKCKFFNLDKLYPIINNNKLLNKFNFKINFSAESSPVIYIYFLKLKFTLSIFHTRTKQVLGLKNIKHIYIVTHICNSIYKDYDAKYHTSRL